MSAPFVYVPEAGTSSSSPAYPAFAYPYHPYPPYPYPPPTTPQGPQTPFLPPSPLLYPPSPFAPPPAEPAPGTPSGAFNPSSVLWPDQSTGVYQPAPAGYVRQRTQSWTAPAQPHGSPFLAPAQPPAFLTANSYAGHGHRRANSHGAASIPPWAQYAPAIPQQIHPFLNGDAPSPDFHFDLALGAFVPLRRAANPAQSMPVPSAELALPAFHPPRAALRIIHAQLPFWPVDVTLPPPPANPGPYAPPMPTSITLADILIALHRALHGRISHADWATLDSTAEQAVTRAYAARCHTEAARSGAPIHALRDVEMSIRSRGVKKVDFLLGRTVFRGLTRAPGDPEGVVRLVTA